MPLAPGLQLGPYELTGLLGAGGMGEVWRARDPRLGRDVAIKVLPEALSRDPERLARFKREAQILAALSHPHVGAIYGLEEQDGVIALVLELVEGPTLEDRIQEGPIPLEEALPIAVQVASGLEAAHERGIVHRDLKPANVKLTAEGQAKVLDFGLAKASPSESSSAPRTHAATVTTGATEAGAVMGTAAYMSPEQARGKAADRRTDVWAFGALLYEMLTGHRAFPGETASDAMAAILRGEADLQALPPEVPPAIRALVRRCLVKEPAKRLQAIGDARVAIEEVLEGKDKDGMLPAAPPAAAAPRAPVALLAAIAVACLALGAAAGWALRRPAPSTPPSFTQLTFERGRISHARFAPDGTVVYAATWGDKPSDLYTTGPGAPGSRSLGMPGASLFAVSRTGELALGKDTRLVAHFLREGMLARGPLAGGAPRELLENVQEADWDPVTGELAVVRQVGDLVRLEFPVGTVLHETAAWISNPRFSPDGSWIAFADHPFGRYDDGGLVTVVGRDGGATRTLGENAYTLEGLAWHPDGREIWYTSGDVLTSLKAVGLDGTVREVASFLATATLRDVAPDGRILLTRETVRRAAYYLPPDGGGEHEVSWLDQSHGVDLSSDGRAVLISEESTGGGHTSRAVLRRVDEPLPVLLGPGSAMAFSADGRWVLAVGVGPDGASLRIYPTGPGRAWDLRTELRPVQIAGFMPDGGRLIFSAPEAGRPPRLWTLPVEGGPARPATSEGYASPGSLSHLVVSPDGATVVAGDASERLFLCEVGGTGAPRAVPGARPGEVPLRFAPDGRSLYVTRLRDVQAPVDRIDLATGARTPVRTILPADPAGLEVYGVFLTPDERTWAYSVKRLTSELFLVDGVR